MNTPEHLHKKLTGVSGFSGSLSATRTALQRRLWLWPIIVALVLGGAGWTVHGSVEEAMRQQRLTDLNTILEASVTALRVWMGEQRINVQLFAEDEQLWPL